MDMDCKDNNHDEQFPHLLESKEPENARRKGKVNLRKRLAWDSAFFTEAGVLDADELSCMIKGGDKQTLPMIEEDVRQSVDFISTLESDNLTLEHIEVELFVDIRASIQKVTISTSGDVSAKTGQGLELKVQGLIDGIEEDIEGAQGSAEGFSNVMQCCDHLVGTFMLIFTRRFGLIHVQWQRIYSIGKKQS